MASLPGQQGEEWPHSQATQGEGVASLLGHVGGRSGLIPRPHGGKGVASFPGHMGGRNGLIPGQCEGKGKLSLPPAWPENKARVLVDQHLDGDSNSSQYDSIGTCTHSRY